MSSSSRAAEGPSLEGDDAGSVPMEPYHVALEARMRAAHVMLQAKEEEDDQAFEWPDRDEKEEAPTWVLEGGRAAADPEPVLVCRKSGKPRYLFLGEGTIEHQQFVEVLPDHATIQAVVEPRQLVTFEDLGYKAKVCVLVYTKERVFMYRWFPKLPSSTILVPVGLFPPAPAWPLPSGARQVRESFCDVWAAELDLPVRAALDAHAAATRDRPIPRYQMIIDPNLFARDTPEGTRVWVPCEFDVGRDGAARLVGGSCSHLHPELVDAVATPVLSAAMPLLAKLRRPRILLAERRLQVVVKAQRIIVPPKASDWADSEYVGLWHVDGHHEHVVAVVLYYYRVDPDLEGGDMEFCGREPLDVLGGGDCEENFEKLSGCSLWVALRGAGRYCKPVAPYCRAPIRNGTLLVFSNYQMVHRVLRMVNRSRLREASRDFVALFVIDPAAKPLVPARQHLARPFLLRRLLGAARADGHPLKPGCVQQVLEFEGCAQSHADRLKKRREMLRAQLQPRGRFDRIGGVYQTGNGCFTMIGWLDGMLQADDSDPDWMQDYNPKGFARLRAMARPPKTVGRGISERLLSSLSSSAESDEAGPLDGLLGDDDDDRGPG